MRVSLNFVKHLIWAAFIASFILVSILQITSAQGNNAYAATISISGAIDKAEALSLIHI